MKISSGILLLVIAVLVVLPVAQAVDIRPGEHSTVGHDYIQEQMDWWSKIKWNIAHGNLLFTAEGSARGCSDSRDYADYLGPGGDEYTVYGKDWCIDHGKGVSALVDWYWIEWDGQQETWHFVAERRDNPTFYGNPTFNYGYEVYCCPHSPCTTDSQCESWYGSGYTCEESTYQPPIGGPVTYSYCNPGEPCEEGWIQVPFCGGDLTKLYQNWRNEDCSTETRVKQNCASGTECRFNEDLGYSECASGECIPNWYCGECLPGDYKNCYDGYGNTEQQYCDYGNGNGNGNGAPPEPGESAFQVTWQSNRYSGVAGEEMQIEACVKNIGTETDSIHLEGFIATAADPWWSGYSVIPMFSTVALGGCCENNEFYYGADIVSLEPQEIRCVNLKPRVPTEDSYDHCNQQGSAWSNRCLFIVGVTATEYGKCYPEPKECYYGGCDGGGVEQIIDEGEFRWFEVTDCESENGNGNGNGEKSLTIREEYIDTATSTTWIKAVCNEDADCEEIEEYDVICDGSRDIREIGMSKIRESYTECGLISGYWGDFVKYAFGHDTGCNSIKALLNSWFGIGRTFDDAEGFCIGRKEGFNLGFLEDEWMGMAIWIWLLIGVVTISIIAASSKKS